MSTIMQFLQALSDFLTKITSYDIIPGVTLFTFLFYNLLIVVVFTAYTRRR